MLRKFDSDSEKSELPIDITPPTPTSAMTLLNRRSIEAQDILLSSDDDVDETSTSDKNVFDKFLILKGLLNEYNRKKRIPISDDPLLWWKMNTKFQPLNSIARQYLSCPPCSVASEQLFSGAGLIYDPIWYIALDDNRRNLQDFASESEDVKF
ncbi:hypothetical protein ILUMI_14594 [Ignelater luminosus]|uniref:HAT C-terminal dimerisation domain-containing protein n=1 Tax=Ignelater luminosus TaxID=2038154 RepID=A0A8K0CQ71_IGNLU|nr:hypothetical protein ILUMI_14594 [Ignelater luminosus]